MTTVATTHAEYAVPDHHRASWGAVFAGLALFLALSWLLLTLGAALGVGIADATDLDAINDGLGIGSIIWFLLTTLISVFAGAMLAARLSGSPDDHVGAMHGVTVWATSTVAVLLIAAMGIAGTVNALGSALNLGVDAGQSVIATVTGDGDLDVPETVETAVQAALKNQTSRALSEAAAGNTVQRSEVRTALEQLGSDDLGAIASDLATGDTDMARQRLANRTTLTEREISAVVTGVEREVEQLEDSEAANQAETLLTEQLGALRSRAVASVSDLAGPELSDSEVREVVRELDADIIADAARHLIAGNIEAAENVLVARTSLSQSEAEAIAAGAQQEVNQVVEQAKAEISQVTEAAGNYAQAVLWTLFIASALGFGAALFGGYLGAGAVRRIYVV